MASDDDWLQVLSPSLQALARRGELRRYRKGDAVIRQGELDSTLLLVLCGRLRAFSIAANGHQTTYGFFGPGDFLGEMSLNGGHRTANVEALTACQCAALTREMLLAHLAERPEFIQELMAHARRRARLERRFDPYDGDERP